MKMDSLIVQVNSSVRIVNYDVDGCVLPFDEIQEVLLYLHYGHEVRIMFEWALLTGCRIAELDRMDDRNLVPTKGGKWIIWALGKNQTGMRKVFIPQIIIDELEYYWQNNRRLGHRLFGISGDTCSSYFNKKIRAYLGKTWQEVRPFHYQGNAPFTYVLQFKGLRKVYQTLGWKRYYDRYGSSEIAINLISKEMGHSTTGMTARYYIINLEKMQIEKYPHLDPKDALIIEYQSRLTDHIIRIAESEIEENETLLECFTTNREGF
jgi:integrase